LVEYKTAHVKPSSMQEIQGWKAFVKAAFLECFVSNFLNTLVVIAERDPNNLGSLVDFDQILVSAYQAAQTFA